MTPTEPSTSRALDEYRVFGLGERSGAQINDTTFLTHIGLGLAIASRQEGENGWLPYLSALRQSLKLRWTRIMAMASSPPRRNGR
jgi:hypothetical protein